MPLEEMGEWAGNSVGGHTKRGNSTMCLCPFLLHPTTTSTTLNPSSVRPKPQCLSSSCYVGKIWKRPQRSPTFLNTSFEACQSQHPMTGSIAVVVVVAEVRYYHSGFSRASKMAEITP